MQVIIKEDGNTDIIYEAEYCNAFDSVSKKYRQAKNLVNFINSQNQEPNAGDTTFKDKFATNLAAVPINNVVMYLKANNLVELPSTDPKFSLLNKYQNYIDNLPILNKKEFKKKRALILDKIHNGDCLTEDEGNIFSQYAHLFISFYPMGAPSDINKSIEQILKNKFKSSKPSLTTVEAITEFRQNMANSLQEKINQSLNQRANEGGSSSTIGQGSTQVLLTEPHNQLHFPRDIDLFHDLTRMAIDSNFDIARLDQQYKQELETMIVSIKSSIDRSTDPKKLEIILVDDDWRNDHEVPIAVVMRDKAHKKHGDEAIVITMMEMKKIQEYGFLDKLPLVNIYKISTIMHKNTSAEVTEMITKIAEGCCQTSSCQLEEIVLRECCSAGERPLGVDERQETDSESDECRKNIRKEITDHKFRFDEEEFLNLKRDYTELQTRPTVAVLGDTSNIYPMEIKMQFLTSENCH